MLIKRFKYRNSNHKRNPFKTLLAKLIAHLTQLSVAFAVLGFINVWFYFYRIDQLNLLTNVISTPSTLLATFASMSLITALWTVLYILPTGMYTWLISSYNKKEDSKSILAHAFIISVILAISGACPINISKYIITGSAVLYLIFFSYRCYTAAAKPFLQNFAIAFAVNIPLIIILGIIYKIISLSQIEREIRVLTLILNLVPIYVTMGASAHFFAKRKTISIKEIILMVAIATVTIAYITLMSAPGLIFKLNDNTMAYVGLRSDQRQWFKVSEQQFPQGWLEANWNVNSISNKEIWLQGYPLFQSNTMLLMCPESTINAMSQYTLARLTFSNSLLRGSMDSSRCILMDNAPGKSVRIGQPTAHVADPLPAYQL